MPLNARRRPPPRRRSARRRGRAAEISGDAQAGRPWKRFASLDYPEFDLCAPLERARATFDVVICEQVIEHVVDPWAAAREPARAVRARRARRRLDAVPDPRPRAAGLRDARLLALHPARAAAAARARGARGRRGRVVGQPALRRRATSTAGRPTGAGIRCATSPTCRCRSGPSPATRDLDSPRDAPGQTSIPTATTPTAGARRSSQSAELMLPCLDAAGARSVVEVGAFAGDLTRVLVEWAAGAGARVLADRPVAPGPARGARPRASRARADPRDEPRGAARASRCPTR